MGEELDHATRSCDDFDAVWSRALLNDSNWFEKARFSLNIYNDSNRFEELESDEDVVLARLRIYNLYSTRHVLGLGDSKWRITLAWHVFRAQEFAQVISIHEEIRDYRMYPFKHYTVRGRVASASAC